MSLNYTTLQTLILSTAHRTELTAEAPDFIRYAEGVIARRLRCAEMLTRVDITDSDRVTVDEGFFTLPSDFLEERSFYLVGSPDYWLEKVSLAELRQLSGSAPTRWFNVISPSEVEFRGVPGTSDTIELIYFARPDPLATTATNSILTNHEGIYLDLALEALYKFTQDLELASVHSESGINAIESLNEQAGRMVGGQRTRGYYDMSSYGRR
ncbi:MAG: hypothetical protein JSW00_08960 [Thermoplasmata archaeon]|nr:MAG: hypothetical protein JSW00_08960 [Thermoplasmata archaeon]